MQVDGSSDIKIVNVLAPVATALADDTAQVGAIIDHRNFGSATYVIQTGTLADANATFAVTLAHGDDAALSDTAAVVDGQLIGTLAGASFTFAADGTVTKLGYIGGKNYSRITITPTGNGGAAPLSVLCILGHPRVGPQSTQRN